MPSENLIEAARWISESSLVCDTETTGIGHESHLKGVNSICVMELANRYFSDHLKWDTEKSQFKRLSLKSCMAIAGLAYQGTAHRALADALAASDLLNHMAKGL